MSSKTVHVVFENRKLALEQEDIETAIRMIAIAVPREFDAFVVGIQKRECARTKALAAAKDAEVARDAIARPFLEALWAKDPCPPKEVVVALTPAELLVARALLLNGGGSDVALPTAATQWTIRSTPMEAPHAPHIQLISRGNNENARFVIETAFFETE